MGTICNQSDRRESHTFIGQPRRTLRDCLLHVESLFEDYADAPSVDAVLAAAVALYEAEYRIDDYDRTDENICGMYEAITEVAAALKDVASTIDRLGGNKSFGG